VIFKDYQGNDLSKQWVRNGVLNENGYYDFYLPVPIHQFADDITIQLVDKDGNAIPCTTPSGKDVTNGYVYSVKTYAQNRKSSTNPKMRALAKALEDYGVAAQIFAQYRDYESLVVSDEVANLPLEDMEGETVVSETRVQGVKATQNVEFGADNSLFVRFTLPSDKTWKDYEMAIDNVTTTPTLISGTTYELRVSNVSVIDLDRYYTFSITDGTDTFTVRTSCLAYAKRKAKNGSEAMVNLAKALYLYNQAGEAYFA
jgi:hypothetical protein